MGKAMFRMVAAGDGAPPTPAGYRYYLLAHAIGTALLLFTLVAAVWQFMDWVVASAPCPESSAQHSVTSAPDAADTELTTVAASVTPPYRATVRLASNPGECDCPERAKTLRTTRDSVVPRPAPDAGTGEKRSPR